MSATHRKQYHQLMSGCGFTGPHKIRTAPTMEYWSGNADAVEEFDAIRFRNQIPFNTMVYRHGGELCVGVFTDMPNPDFRCSDSPLLAAAPELLAALEALVGEADLGEVDLDDDDRTNLDNARAAIAKAKGVK